MQARSQPGLSTLRFPTTIGCGRAWLKLSGPYLNSLAGKQKAYIDSDIVARAWIEAAPDRLVWGSDWPHVTEATDPPHTSLMREILHRWVNDKTTLHKILVDNPAQLYGFNEENRQQ